MILLNKKNLILDCKFVAGARDGTISLWDLESQKLIRKASIPNNLVSRLN